MTATIPDFQACRDLIYVHSMEPETFKVAFCNRAARPIETVYELAAIRIRNLQQQSLGAGWREAFKFTMHG